MSKVQKAFLNWVGRYFIVFLVHVNRYILLPARVELFNRFGVCFLATFIIKIYTVKYLFFIFII